jgi:hypothetical protein
VEINLLLVDIFVCHSYLKRLRNEKSSTVKYCPSGYNYICWKASAYNAVKVFLGIDIEINTAVPWYFG